MIRLLSAELHRLELRARMPFRYGIATMTDVPQVILRATFELDGTVHAGFAADLLPPVFVGILVLAGWESLVCLAAIPVYILPAPSRIAARLVEDAPTLFASLLVTLFGR